MAATVAIVSVREKTRANNEHAVRQVPATDDDSQMMVTSGTGVLVGE